MFFEQKKKCVDEDVANPASSVGGRVGNTDRQTKKQREKERESLVFGLQLLLAFSKCQITAQRTRVGASLFRIVCTMLSPFP